MNHIIGASAPTPAPSVKTLTVDEDSAGQRLDNFLMRHLKGVPKTHVYRIIRSGEVRVNKGRASAEQRVEAGDLVRLPPVRVSAQVQAKADAPAPAREFPVLMEDECMMAIDKPAGVAVHGGSGVSFGVIEQLRQARPTAKFLELVHRIDRETSGILLLAKKRSALTALQEQVAGYLTLNESVLSVRDAISDLAKSLTIGDPLDPNTKIGPMVSSRQRDRVEGYIAKGKKEGRLTAGGSPPKGLDHGWFVEPTVFDGVTNQMKIAREEIFGPVMSVIRFKTEAEAIAIANDSPYGLQASVWSHQIDRAHRVARSLRAGTVHVNQYDEDDITVPFGGVKQSGIGRDKSLHAMDKYCQVKNTYIQL